MTGTAEHFTSDARRVGAQFEFNGRSEIERFYEFTLFQNRGATLAINISSIRFLSADAAIVQATYEITGGGFRRVRQGRLLHAVVRQGSRWLRAESLVMPDPATVAVRPAPTYEDVAYGPHERNVLDFWKADSEAPTPLVVYIHGGGFTTGSKDEITARILRELLESGISVAAINYRLLSDDPAPAAHHDARRALQFIRSKATEWHFDKSRIGASGISAGAQLCMWLAFHDEMAKPESSDPLERESSRLRFVATIGGQTTLDPDWWKRWIPGFDLYSEQSEKLFFGSRTKEERAKLREELSSLSLLTADDPPIYMSYWMSPDDPVPEDPFRAIGWKVHHVIFGVKLKEAMDVLGLEADLEYPGTQSTYHSIPQYFKVKFGKDH